jgi:hypothetical protein
MRRTLRVGVLLLGALVLAVSPAAAQTSSTFDALAQTARAGQRVTVTTADGRRFRGDVVAVSADSLTLDVDHSWGRADSWRDSSRQTFGAGDVSLVQRSDRLWNGILIGLAAGVAGAEGFVRYNCGPRGNDDECAAIASLVGYGVFPAGGALTGALIDKFIGNHVLFRRDGRVTLTAAPEVSASRQAVFVSLRWGRGRGRGLPPW